MKQLYLLPLLAILALTGCKKDDDASRPGNLTIEKTEYTLDADEERTATVAFTAAADWTLSVVYDDAESSANWLSVTPMSGTAGEQTVELSAARIFRASARTAYADLACGKQSVRLTVTQTAASDATFTAAADWTLSVVYDDAESSANWLSVTPMSGTAGEQTVELSAARNFRASARTAYADLACGKQSVRLTVTQTAASDATDFTAQFDPDFAKELQKQGIIADAGNITPEDMEKIAAITRLDIAGSYDNPGTLTSLRGIEYFEALEELSCLYNQLTSLDVSRNTALTELRCDYNQLTSLDVSRNMALTELRCDYNQLTSLDVSRNTALTYLDCNNNQLTELDVSRNTALTELDCSGNPLTTLDISMNTALTKLYCAINELTTLDVSRNTALTELNCANNELTTLDVSQNTALTVLSCFSNELPSLNISRNRALTKFDCSYNPGDGVSSFPVTAWFDNDTKPGDLEIDEEQWKYDGKTITIDFRKAE
uniref:BACON domain-containing protein n=1 Tax=Alistipes sp. Marseille-P5061 TaxID=2048242 RepID=UPI000D113BF1|nr:BACON domain-containing carbohydrate-binding protein [Alistipes sp. Marseille-P5061]